MKLIIQIPCFNEEKQLPETLAELPRHVPGFENVEWLIIDDGSSDRTVEVARAHGVDHIVSFPANRGLAAAFQTGLDACLKLGADVVVNTDADNQYSAGSIPDLVKPVVDGEADLAIGNRNVMEVEEFSPLKKRLQRLGSGVVRAAARADVSDTTSGFRAYSREAALRLIVVNRYTYTIESIIQAGKSGLRIANVDISTNPKTRESRLFNSMTAYIRRSAGTITRVFAAYEPFKFFGAMALFLFGLGLLSFLPLLLDWAKTGERSGHLQSVILGAILVLSSFQVFVLAVVADLIASHRVVSQQTLERVRRLEIVQGVDASYLVSEPATNDQ